MEIPKTGDASVRASAEGQKKPSEVVMERLDDAAKNAGSLAAERVLALSKGEFEFLPAGTQEGQAEAARTAAGEPMKSAKLRLSQTFDVWNERVSASGFDAARTIEHLKKNGKTFEAPIAFDVENPDAKGVLNAGEPIGTMRIAKDSEAGGIKPMDPESRIAMLIALGAMSEQEANLAADRPQMTEKEFDRLIIQKAGAYSQGAKFDESNYDVRLPIGDPKLTGFAVRLFKGRLRDLGMTDRTDMNAGVLARGVVLDFEQAFKRARGVEN